MDLKNVKGSKVVPLKEMISRSFVFIFLAPLAILYIFIALSSMNTVLENMVAERSNMIELINLSLGEKLMELEQDVINLASNQSIQEMLENTDFHRFDSKLYNAHKFFEKTISKTMASSSTTDNIVLISRNGGKYCRNVLSDEIREILRNYITHDYIAKHCEGTLFLGDLHNKKGDKVFALIRPIIDLELLEITGIALVTYPYSELREAILHQSGVAIIDNSGTLLLSSIINGAELEEHLQQFPIGDQDYRLMIGTEQIVLIRSEYNRFGLAILHVFSLSEIRRNFFAKQWHSLIILIFAAALVGLFATYLYRRLNRNLQKIKQIQNDQETNDRDSFDCYELKNIGEEILSLRLIREEKEKDIIRLINKCETINLDKLQAQINPHFLYNTLTSIKYIAILNNQSQINNVITALVKLLRSVINRDGSLIAVRDEIEDVRSYIQIQDTVYRGNIKFEINISDEVLDMFIPNFILQPLIENSIFHGIHPKEAGGIITVNGFLEENQLMFEVVDNGDGIKQESAYQILGHDNIASNSFTNLGISSIHQKIRLQYGDGYGLKIFSKKDRGTIIKINLPINEDDE